MEQDAWGRIYTIDLPEGNIETILKDDLESSSEEEILIEGCPREFLIEADKAKIQRKEKREAKQEIRNESKKKLIYIYQGSLIRRSRQRLNLHPIEKLFNRNQWTKIYKRGDFTIVFKLDIKFFKKKEDNEYKSKRDPRDLPVDFSSTKGQPVDVPRNLRKYYENRHYLFSKFDEGIKLDEQSWYSVTPEEIAVYTAKKCKSECVLDGFAGVGGNVIQFALAASKAAMSRAIAIKSKAVVLRATLPEVAAPKVDEVKVYANDIDTDKLDMLMHNATIYKVQDKIEILNKDFLELTKKDFEVKPTVVFLSPPWGGIRYAKEKVYDFTQMQPNFMKILRKSLELASNILIFLPRNTDLNIFADILFEFPQLFTGYKSECVVGIEALVYGDYSIKALLVSFGERFAPKLYQLMPSIKFLLKAQLSDYENILIQNVLKYKPFYECYELALQINKEGKGPKEYIESLKASLTTEEWTILKKSHKKPLELIKLMEKKQGKTPTLNPPINEEIIKVDNAIGADVIVEGKRKPSEDLDEERIIPKKQAIV